MEKELEFLREQGVDSGLIDGVEEFRSKYDVAEEAKGRVICPDMPFYGREVLEMGIAALLEGENLLLTGPKATGKNMLAENLAWIFGRPVYNVSFHVNTNSGDLIGTDTFVNNEVELRKGSIYRAQSSAVLEFWMKSIWRRMMRFLFFMPPWITGAALTCRDMIRSICTTRRGLSER